MPSLKKTLWTIHHQTTMRLKCKILRKKRSDKKKKHDMLKQN